MAHFAKLDSNNKVLGIHVLHNNVITESTMKILKYLGNIILIINNEINNINNEIEEHSKKWFSKIRQSNCNEMFKNLKNHIKILDDRFNLLLKLINI